MGTFPCVVDLFFKLSVGCAAEADLSVATNELISCLLNHNWTEVASHLKWITLLPWRYNYRIALTISNNSAVYAVEGRTYRLCTCLNNGNSRSSAITALVGQPVVLFFAQFEKIIERTSFIEIKPIWQSLLAAVQSFKNKMFEMIKQFVLYAFGVSLGTLLN